MTRLSRSSTQAKRARSRSSHKSERPGLEVTETLAEMGNLILSDRFRLLSEFLLATNLSVGNRSR